MGLAPDRRWALMTQVGERSYGSQRVWTSKVNLSLLMKMVDADKVSRCALILLGRW